MKSDPRQKAWEFEEFPTHDAHSRDYWHQAGEILHRLVREAVQSSGEKQGASLAADVGAHPPQFSEAINGSSKNFADRWLPRLIVTPGGLNILRFLCGLRGMEPKPLPVNDPEAKLRMLVESNLRGGLLGRAALNDAFGDETDRVIEALLRRAGDKP